MLRWWMPFVATVATVATVGTALAVLSLGPARDDIWDHPDLAFASVLVLTAACAIGAGLVFALGLSRRVPEVALLGAVLAASVGAR